MDIVVGFVGGQPVDRAKALDQTCQRGTVVAAFPARIAFIDEKTGAIDRLVDVVRQAARALQPVCRLYPSIQPRGGDGRQAMREGLLEIELVLGPPARKQPAPDGERLGGVALAQQYRCPSVFLAGRPSDLGGHRIRHPEGFRRISRFRP